MSARRTGTTAPQPEPAEEPGRAPPLTPLLVVVLLGAVVLATLAWFVVPTTDAVGEVADGPVPDAVVVLGGGPGDRLGTAVELLVALGPAAGTELVLFVPHGPPLVTCGTLPQLPAVPVRCTDPVPATTAGEAVGITDDALDRGWDHVVVVTSDFHVTRARRLVARCVEVRVPELDVSWVAAPTEPLSAHGAFAIATEWPSLLATAWDHEPPCVEDG